MGNTRTNEDGFRGEYPGPLDWDLIEAGLRASERGVDGGDDPGPECDNLDP